jgi:hypothetical protein
LEVDNKNVPNRPAGGMKEEEEEDFFGGGDRTKMTTIMPPPPLGLQTWRTTPPSSLFEAMVQ